MRLFASVALALTLGFPFAASGPVHARQTASASSSPAQDRREIAGRIIGAAIVDDTGWNRLAFLCDRIGHRLSGSAALEKAIAWAVDELRRDGLDNVHTEKVLVPHWVRGAESATLIERHRRNLPVS